MTTHDAFDDALAAYALDALDHTERAAFEGHLATCASCQRELVDLRRVTAGIGLGVTPEVPPASLKARTMARATGEARRTAEVMSPSARPAPTASGWGSLALAASLLVAVGLGVYAAALRSQVLVLRETVQELSTRAETLRAEAISLRRDAARLTNVMEILRAPDTIRVNLRGQTGNPVAAGRAYVSGDRGLVFSVSQLPVLPAGRVYQIWVIPPDRAPESAGVFNVNASGQYDVALPLSMTADAVRGIAVTIEPGPAGSPQGTTPPILIGMAGD